jgi:hypothetical protein
MQQGKVSDDELDELVVPTVTVDDEDTAEAALDEGLRHIAQRAVIVLGRERDGPAKREMVVRRAGLERRGHEYVQFWLRLTRGCAGHVLHDQKVGAKGEVWSMLLGRAHRQDQERAGRSAASFLASDLVQEEPGSIAKFARVTMRHVPPQTGRKSWVVGRKY